jgi:hypothetical protein
MQPLRTTAETIGGKNNMAKLSQCVELRELVKADTKTFPTKEKGKSTIYKRLKENILERIGYLEALKLKELKYLADIDEYLTKIEKQFKVTFELKGLPSSGTKADIKPAGEPQEGNKPDSKGKLPAEEVSTTTGGSGVQSGNGSKTL